MRSSIVKITGLIGILFCLGISSGYAITSYDQKHIEVSLRMIGHQVLLQAGDSSSRILPLERRGESYWLGFENEFVLNPDKLILIIDSVGRSSQLQGGYILEVLDCGSSEVVYSYEKKKILEASTIPCLGRDYPKSCYEFLITFFDEEAPVQENKVIPSSTDDKGGSQWIGGVIVLLGLVTLGLFGRGYIHHKRKQAEPNDTHTVAIGKYQFNSLRSELRFGNASTELTSKEADLLILLYQAINTTLEREFILKRVWGDEGDYVGRTLDVFISRLRKKLESDPDIKIVNIRGIGYKMILDSESD